MDTAVTKNSKNDKITPFNNKNILYYLGVLFFLYKFAAFIIHP